jgi:hypothetical protein
VSCDACKRIPVLTGRPCHYCGRLNVEAELAVAELKEKRTMADPRRHFEQPNVYQDTRARYESDAAFHSLVDWMRYNAQEHGFTPGELKQAAFYAAYLVELYNPKPFTLGPPDPGLTDPQSEALRRRPDQEPR